MKNCYTLLLIFILAATFMPKVQGQEKENASFWKDSLNIGYGQASLADINSSIAVIRAPDYASSLFTSPDQMMQGMAAGVFATQSSGQGAAEMVLRIRGINSLSSGAQPLYIIDGFPLYNDNGAISTGLTAGPRLNGLAMLNPDEIATISVLKDAAATAIYGSRAANGVVIIETKRGRSDIPSMEVNAYVGIQDEISKYDLLTASQYAGYINEAYTNAGLEPVYANPASFGAGTDWQKEIYRESAPVQHYQLAFQGSSQNIDYRISGAFDKKEGIIKSSDFIRANLHANIDARLNPKSRLTNSFNLTRIEASTVSTDDPADDSASGIFSGALRSSPVSTVADAEGKLLLNPVAQALLSDSEVQLTRLTNQLQVGYDILSHLRFGVSAGIDAVFNEEQSYISSDLEPDIPLGGVGAGAKLQSLNWANEYTLNYHTPINGGNQLGVLAGFGIQGFVSEQLGGLSRGFENEALRYYSLGVGQSKSVNSFFANWQMASWFGRVNYTHDNKFTLSFTGRADASSRFGGNYAFFPAGGFSWNIRDNSGSSERGNLSRLKLRVSYGLAGNQEIAPYSTLSILEQFESSLNGNQLDGFRPANLGNSSLEIERTTQLNVGFDIGLLNDRLALVFDVYDKITDNALMLLPVAAQSGFSMALANGVEIVNRGFELSLHSRNFEGDFTWNTFLTAAFNENEITAIPGNIDIPFGEELQGVRNWTLLQTGSAIGSFYGYQSEGILQTGETAPGFEGETLQAGDRKYKDLNGDGVINSLDKTIIGSSQPDISFGIHNSFSFKGIDLQVFFQGTLGNEIANFNNFLVAGLDANSNISVEAYENRWTSSNPSSQFPRPLVSSQKGQVLSDAYLEDGSFLRLKNLSLGYTLPEKLFTRINLSRLRLYLSAQNLWTISKYSGIDPDVSHFGQSNFAAGIDLGGYPKSKTFAAGINLSF